MQRRHSSVRRFLVNHDVGVTCKNNNLQLDCSWWWSNVLIRGDLSSLADVFRRNPIISLWWKTTLTCQLVITLQRLRTDEMASSCSDVYWQMRLYPLIRLMLRPWDIKQCCDLSIPLSVCPSCQWVHFVWPDPTQPTTVKKLDPTRLNPIRLTMELTV